MVGLHVKPLTPTPARFVQETFIGFHDFGATEESCPHLVGETGCQARSQSHHDFLSLSSDRRRPGNASPARLDVALGRPCYCGLEVAAVVASFSEIGAARLATFGK